MNTKRIICLLLTLISSAVIVTANASNIFDLLKKNNKTVTISQEEYDRLSRYKKMDTSKTGFSKNKENGLI